MGALRAAGLTSGQVSAAGVLAFLEWGSVPPPLTWTRGVEMLQPGTWRRWRMGASLDAAHGTFADARDQYHADSQPRMSLPAFRRDVAGALRDSVRAHLVADVPVGVFLSGGIDSGAILSCAV